MYSSDRWSFMKLLLKFVLWEARMSVIPLTHYTAGFLWALLEKPFQAEMLHSKQFVGRKCGEPGDHLATQVTIWPSTSLSPTSLIADSNLTRDTTKL